MLYSKNKAKPELLPPRIRFLNGFTRTALHECDPDQLEAWGFEEAPNPPDYNGEIQVLDWEKGEWVVRDKTKGEYEKEKETVVAEKESIQFRVVELEAKEQDLDTKILSAKAVKILER